ncbi:MAG: hypothetical protein ACI9BW_003388 [Gammaproteobacteria bacterium]|jgi:hypothetical protein
MNPATRPRFRFEGLALIARVRSPGTGTNRWAAPASRICSIAMVIASSLGLMHDLSASSPAPVERVLPAESFLSFEDKLDGRCQNLSPGGKLTIIHNAHPTETIRFRLIRYFVDVRQQGRATGVLLPDGNPVKIGCNLVDGRKQRWVVEKADFIAPLPE